MRAHAIDYNARVRTLGCDIRPDGRAFFRLWAPEASRVQLHLLSPTDRLLDMRPADAGYYELELAGLKPGVRYKYRLGDDEFPDPVSKSQPDGVHVPSEVIEEYYRWTDEHWHGIPLEKYVIYELHVGTFS